MARIRSIKPEFFRHKRLFELENQHKMPLRVSFAGIWTAADREGRFKWEPEALKLDCLPWDKVDFESVLEILLEGGFIEKYEKDGKLYGCVPSWSDHQVINNRESPSKLPENPRVNGIAVTRHDICSDASSDATRGEGKGREGKGREDAGPSFALWWDLYPKKTTKTESFTLWKKLKPDDLTVAQMLAALKTENKLREQALATGAFFPAPLDAIRWLKRERWKDVHDTPEAKNQPVTCEHPWDTFKVLEEFPHKVMGHCAKCGKDVLRERG